MLHCFPFPHNNIFILDCELRLCNSDWRGWQVDWGRKWWAGYVKAQPCCYCSIWYPGCNHQQNWNTRSVASVDDNHMKKKKEERKSIKQHHVLNYFVTKLYSKQRWIPVISVRLFFVSKTRSNEYMYANHTHYNVSVATWGERERRESREIRSKASQKKDRERRQQHN